MFPYRNFLHRGWDDKQTELIQKKVLNEVWNVFQHKNNIVDSKQKHCTIITQWNLHPENKLYSHLQRVQSIIQQYRSRNVSMNFFFFYTIKIKWLTWMIVSFYCEEDQCDVQYTLQSATKKLVKTSKWVTRNTKILIRKYWEK